MADKKNVEVQETKSVKTFQDKINEELKRKRDLTAKDIKEMQKLPVVIERRKSKNSGNEYFVMKLFISEDYPEGFVQPKEMLDLTEYTLIEMQNNLEPSDHHVIKAPVRFFSGENKRDGSEYIRVEILLSKDVYRSIFIPYKMQVLLDLKKINLNPVPDFVSQEGTEVLF